ncbi:hypothetical protein RPMA_08965 [Tardiphaga alba]|uniref:Antitoxin n=1 Tax=Tardiphaga alba TaxID=340268 RepID=A0ABX8A5G0_9BRAD|nr:hypothetical protein [Tardiphaga alba]QUS38939.1 hypothetical protein RPMA_08965 [Tardiphaga alba]
MNTIRRSFDIDPDTDARLRVMAAERGQDESAVLAEALALLDSVIDLDGPDLAEDVRRLEQFRADGLAVPLDDVKAWVESWDTPDELPAPIPRRN